MTKIALVAAIAISVLVVLGMSFLITLLGLVGFLVPQANTETVPLFIISAIVAILISSIFGVFVLRRITTTNDKLD